MRAAGPLLVAILASGLAAGACHRKPDSTLTLPAERAVSLVRRDEPPVALDPESPVGYPPAVFQQRISGTVLLRLYVDEAGHLVPDSSRVQESSGYPALDSAALAAVPGLHYAPALRNGSAVATVFTQPVHFRHPDRGGTTP
jgi:TonB family protein